MYIFTRRVKIFLDLSNLGSNLTNFGAKPTIPDSLASTKLYKVVNTSRPRPQPLLLLVMECSLIALMVVPCLLDQSLSTKHVTICHLMSLDECHLVINVPHVSEVCHHLAHISPWTMTCDTPRSYTVTWEFERKVCFFTVIKNSLFNIWQYWLHFPFSLL